jgi:hypothetical protein
VVVHVQQAGKIYGKIYNKAGNRRLVFETPDEEQQQHESFEASDGARPARPEKAVTLTKSTKEEGNKNKNKNQATN